MTALEEPKEPVNNGVYWVRDKPGASWIVLKDEEKYIVLQGYDYPWDWDALRVKHGVTAIEPVLGPSWSRSLHSARLAMLDSERVERERIAREWPNVTPLDPPAFEGTRFPVPKGPSGP